MLPALLRGHSSLSAAQHLVSDDLSNLGHDKVPLSRCQRIVTFGPEIARLFDPLLPP